MKNLEAVLEDYSIDNIQSITPNTTGLIHKTYIVESNNKKYVLQQLHTDLSSDNLLNDYNNITAFLNSSNFPAPRLILTGDGDKFVETAEGRFRLISFIEGIGFEEILSKGMVFEAAKILGKFHKTMADYGGNFTNSRSLHDSKAYLDKFNSVVKSNTSEEVNSLIESISTNMPLHFLPDDLPKRVIHGDPKISNVLFEKSDGPATGLVDLDSCGIHTVLVDIGDAMRSWCRTGLEDELTPFRLDIFSYLLQGYHASGAVLDKKEISLIPDAGMLIILECTCRMVTDYFEDKYFGWDKKRYPSRKEHNLARARSMMNLYETTKLQRDSINKIVEDIFM